MLGLAEGIEPLGTELAADAAVAHAAEGPRVVVGQRVVDPERAGLDELHRAHRDAEVFGVDRRTEPELGVIGEADRFVGIPHHGHRQNRSEDLLAGRQAAVPHAGQQSRLEEMAGQAVRLEAPSAAQEFSALGDGARHLPRDALRRRRANQRSDVGVRVHRVADDQRIDLGRGAADELRGDRLLDIDALRGGAHLPGVQHARPHHARYRDIEVRVPEHEEGIDRAELEVDRLELRTGAGGDAPADGS